MNRNTRDVIESKLGIVNHYIAEYYNSNIEKIKVCKGCGGYAIEVVIDGNQIDFCKSLTAKEVCRMLDILWIVIDGHCTDGDMGEQKKKNTDFILSLVKVMNNGI